MRCDAGCAFFKNNGFVLQFGSDAIASTISQGNGVLYVYSPFLLFNSAGRILNPNRSYSSITGVEHTTTVFSGLRISPSILCSTCLSVYLAKSGLFGRSFTSTTNERTCIPAVNAPICIALKYNGSGFLRVFE